MQKGSNETLSIMLSHILSLQINSPASQLASPNKELSNFLHIQYNRCLGTLNAKEFQQDDPSHKAAVSHVHVHL